MSSRGRGQAEDAEAEEEAEHAHRENESARGGIGITTIMLANGQHRVQKMLRNAPAANAEVIKTGDTLIRVDNIFLKDVQTDAVTALLMGPLESGVESELVSVNGITRVITLTRAALCLNSVSWARAMLPLRIRRLELVESSEALLEAECMEQDELVAGEACFLRIRGKLAAAGFRTFDSIPRRGKSKTNLRFSCPKVRGISVNDELLLTAWLAHLRVRRKHMASLKMLQVKPTCLPSMGKAARRSTKKTIEDTRLKTQRLKQQSEQSRPDGPLHSALKPEIDRIIAKCDLLWANWRMD